MRGEWDGIAGVDDLLEVLRAACPNLDKQFVVTPHRRELPAEERPHPGAPRDASTQPDPVYRG